MKKYFIVILIGYFILSLTTKYAFAFFAVPVRDSYSRITLSNIFSVLDTMSTNIARDLPALNTNIARVLQALMEEQSATPVSDVAKMNLYFNLAQDSSAFLNSLEENTPSYRQQIFDEGQKVGLIKALNQLPDILKCIPEGRRDSFKYFVMNYLQPYDLSLKGEEIIDAIPDCAQTSENPPVTSKIIIPYSLSLLNPFNMAYFLGNIHSPGTNPFNFQAPSIVIVNKSNETFEDIYYENLIQATESHLSIGRDLEVYKRFQEMGSIMPAFEQCQSDGLMINDSFTDSGQPLCGSRKILISGEEFKNVVYNQKRDITPFLASIKDPEAFKIAIQNQSNFYLPYNFANVTYNPNSQNNQQNNPFSSPSNQQNNQSQPNEIEEERLTNITPESVQELYDNIAGNNQSGANTPSNNNSTGQPSAGSVNSFTDFINDVLDNSFVFNGVKFGDLKKKFCDKVAKDNKPVSGLIGNVSCMKNVVSGLSDFQRLRIIDLERKLASLDRFNQFLDEKQRELDEIEGQIDSANCSGASAFISQQKDKIQNFHNRASSAKVRLRASFDKLQEIINGVNQYIAKANGFINTFNRFTVSLQEGINEVLDKLKAQQVLAALTAAFDIPILSDIAIFLDVMKQIINAILTVINAPAIIHNALSSILMDFNGLLNQFGVQMNEIRDLNRDLILIDREYLSQINILSTMHRQGIDVEILKNNPQCRSAKKAQQQNSGAIPYLKNKQKYITYYSPQSQQNKGIFNALVANILSIKKIFEPKILTINLQ